MKAFSHSLLLLVLLLFVRGWILVMCEVVDSEAVSGWIFVILSCCCEGILSLVLDSDGLFSELSS